MEVPTKRFLLRDFAEADRPAFLAYQADPRARAFYGPEEANPMHAAQLFEDVPSMGAGKPAPQLPTRHRAAVRAARARRVLRVAEGRG